MSSQLTLLKPERGEFPRFHATVSALGDIPALLYRALEFGTGINREFFEKLSQNEKPRPHIREMIVRDQAKQFLRRNDFSVDEEPVSVGNEPLAALVIRLGPVQIRVLKASGGVVPGCGTSDRRRSFYNQYREVYQDRLGKVRETRLNLLVLWDFDSLFNLHQLWMACPMRGGERSADVLLYWHEKLEHPAEVPVIPPAADAQQKTEDELERLLRDDEFEEQTEAEKA